MQMSSGVDWNEDDRDPQSYVSIAGAYNGVELASHLSKVARRAPAGERFNYNTGEANHVGELLRAAIGNNAATYLTHKIWQAFGMQADATWLINKPSGGETGG